MTESPGAHVGATGTTFVLWAPLAADVAVVIGDRRHALEPLDDGYWRVFVDGAGDGDTYRYSIDGGDLLPDPASAHQPDGVHGSSAIVDPQQFEWSDDEWRGRRLAGTVVYELHVGTFTPAGTLDAAILELPRLSALGVTTVELMPVNGFPGRRNWGYDGVFAYAVQDNYGGPAALARFVDAAHAHGLAVILDVVYNHLGPEGNYLPRFGPYFTDEFQTPWGPAVNVSGRGSDGVRRYFVENAVRWVRDFHVDGFRFDAVHAIVDPTASQFWGEVCTAVRAAAARQRRAVVLIGESSDNDPRQLHAERARRHRLRCRVVRRRAPHAAGGDDRRSAHVLRRLRRHTDRTRRHGDPPLEVPGPVLDRSRSPARAAGRRRGGTPVRRLFPEPRPGRQPSGR